MGNKKGCIICLSSENEYTCHGYKKDTNGIGIGEGGGEDECGGGGEDEGGVADVVAKFGTDVMTEKRMTVMISVELKVEVEQLMLVLMLALTS